MNSKILCLILLVGFVSCAPLHEESTRGCGTHDVSVNEMRDISGLTQRFVARTCAADPTLFYCDTPQAETVNVNIKFAFHNIYNPANNEGYLTQNEIDGQMYVLNNDFAGGGNESSRTSFQFVLVNLTRTGNANWFSQPQRYENEFKQALAISPIDTFNNYFTDMSAGLLGWCWFPNDWPEDSHMHGCVNLYSSVPGGSSTNYNLGKTVVHEIGHGVGLYHVFQGGVCSEPNCNTAGDMVCDTPPQRTSTSGCPVRQDSCNDGSEDNYHNYMDYSYDDCMDQFTPGQSDRMDQMVAAHKPGYLGEELVNKIKRAVPDAWDEIRAYAAKKSKILDH